MDDASVSFMFDDQNTSQYSSYIPNGDPSRDIQAYVTELEAYKDRPRDMLIDHIRSITHDNVSDLDQLRHELFRLSILRDDFPIKEGHLPRRLRARRVGAASMEMKLARDCFILLRAIEGEFSEDLHDVVLTKKRVENPSTNNSANVEDIAGVQLLKELVATLQADMHGIKTVNERTAAEVKSHR